eukprot:359295-Chlamydomonas_euryale.AAC.1
MRERRAMPLCFGCRWRPACPCQGGQRRRNSGLQELSRCYTEQGQPGEGCRHCPATMLEKGGPGMLLLPREVFTRAVKPSDASRMEIVVGVERRGGRSRRGGKEGRVVLLGPEEWGR